MEEVRKRGKTKAVEESVRKQMSKKVKKKGVMLQVRN